MDTPTKLEQALERLATKDALIAELRADIDTAQRQTVATKTWGEGYQNALSLYFDKMGLNGAGSLDDRMARVAKVCGESTTLHRIAGLAGIGSWDDPDTVRLVITDMRTARDDARARVKDLERDLADKDASLKTAHAALKRICEVIGAPVPCVAEDAVEAVKKQIGDDNDANARAERAEAALTRISEIVGAPADVSPDTVVDGARMLRSTAQHATVRATQAEATIAEIGHALADAGAPQAYHLDDDTERPIPNPERIRLLGERVHTLRAQLREVTDATNYLDALVEAHNALDALNAPRLADGCVLSLAARVRSLPR